MERKYRFSKTPKPSRCGERCRERTPRQSETATGFWDASFDSIHADAVECCSMLPASCRKLQAGSLRSPSYRIIVQREFYRGQTVSRGGSLLKPGGKTLPFLALAVVEHGGHGIGFLVLLLNLQIIESRGCHPGKVVQKITTLAVGLLLDLF